MAGDTFSVDAGHPYAPNVVLQLPKMLAAQAMVSTTSYNGA
jgi:hypothetical protein